MLHANVADGVHRIEDSYTNWYLVEEDGRLTVVDAGVPTSWRSLREALSELGHRLGDVEAVVLTHAHFDHLGFAERARSELGVPVYVHENDMPLARHPSRYTMERPRSLYFATQIQALPIVASLLRTRAFWPSPVKELVRFDNDSLPVPGSPRVVATPGHTLGHCAFHLPERDALIAGDALVTLDPYTGATGPRVPPCGSTADSRQAIRSLDRLAATAAATLLTGHGEPWRDGAAEAAQRARRAGVA